jgi:hypothetical protein
MVKNIVISNKTAFEFMSSIHSRSIENKVIFYMALLYKNVSIWFTFGLILFAIPFSTFGQNYKPMLDQNAEWQVTYCFFDCLTDAYFTDGDTIVDNKVYKILDGYHYISRTFLLREYVQEKKVYLNIIGSEKNEYLLYDYSLMVGDSIDMKNPNTPFLENAGYYIVDSIVDKPLNNGLNYKHYYLSPSSSNLVSFNNAIWIEGIGSLSIVTAPSGEPDINGVGHLSCHFKGANSDLIYSNLDSIAGCTPLYNLSKNPFENSLDPVVLNNSIITNNCNLTNTKNVTGFRIYDIHGRLQKLKRVYNKDFLSINMLEFESGLYFLELTGMQQKKIFKIIKK